MGVFEESFNEPVYFSEGAYALDRCMSREEAAEIFSKHLDEDVTPGSLDIDRVRFRFGLIDDELVSAWFTGAGTGKGTKPVWVLD